MKEGFEKCDDVIVKCIERAIGLIKSSNKFSEVRQVSIPDHSEALVPFSVIAFSSAQHQLVDGCGYGTSVSGVISSSLPEKFYDGLKSQSHTLHDMAKYVIVSNAYMTKYGGHTMYTNYAKAQNWFWHLGKAYSKALEEFDVLLMPTLPVLPSKIPDGKEIGTN